MSEQYHRDPPQNQVPYNYYPLPFIPNYPPPPAMQQPRLPAHTAQFLLGMTNVMPPLSGREIAALSSANQPAILLDAKSAQQPSRSSFQSLDPMVLLPPGTDATLTVNRRDLNVGDLLARVRANMEVHEDVPLGWRLTNEAENATRRLQTVEDAQLAVETLLQKLDSPHRRNEVMLEIADCREKAKAASKPAPQPTELAYREELTIVKDKLRCQSANHSYCYIPTTGPRVGQHVALSMQDVTLWAREMKNGNVPRDCSAPPNCLKTDEIIAKREERKQRTSRPGVGTQVDVNPHIHINLADTPLGQVYRPQRDDTEQATLGKRAREGSPSDDDPVIVPVDDLLADLNRKMPASGFFEYCHQILGFSEQDLAELGVGRGAVKDLIRGARQILRMKRPRGSGESDKENVPDAVEA
ncbi:hypothetical protein DFH09DRAFT_1095610 [Mycena vulgaris]|nr:hypothetical protein DFH09DRAFT_1095610 [Mycena vulgaris]